jgi:uncharacterized protein
MAYVVTVQHHPGKSDLRESLREAHRRHLASAGDALIGAGAVLDEDGEITGGMIILDEPDRDAAEAFDRRDPYAEAGLIRSREITRWRLRWSFGEFRADGFDH